MKKTDVYVVVDTPKKAKKLKKVLDMFGEKVYEDRVWHDDGYPYYATDDCLNYWVGDYLKDSEDLKNKTEVSIKALRNILAKEYLKEGDYVVSGINGSDDKWLVKFESFIDHGDFLGYYTDLQSSYKLTPHKGLFDNFLRYATDEEKELLDPADKFAELKEAHRNGAMIQMLINVNWIDVNNPLWDDKYEYRIKPSEIFTDSDIEILERLHDTLLDNHSYSLGSKLLTDARMLANKIKSNIK